MPSPERSSARAVVDRFARMRLDFPDFETFQVLEPATDGRVKVRKPHWPEGKFIKVPAQNLRDARSYSAGMGAVVGYEEGNRQLPFLQRLGAYMGAIATTPPIAALGLWSQWESTWMHDNCATEPVEYVDIPESGEFVLLATLHTKLDGSAEVTEHDSRARPLGLVSFEDANEERLLGLVLPIFDADGEEIAYYALQHYDALGNLVREVQIETDYEPSPTATNLPPIVAIDSNTRYTGAVVNEGTVTYLSYIDEDGTWSGAKRALGTPIADWSSFAGPHLLDGAWERTAGGDHLQATGLSYPSSYMSRLAASWQGAYNQKSGISSSRLEKVEQLNVLTGGTLSQEWDWDPSTALGADYALKSDPAGYWPCDPTLTTWRVWVTGRKRLDLETVLDVYVAAEGHNDYFVSSNVDIDTTINLMNRSRELKAKVLALATDDGSPEWTYTLTVTPEEDPTALTEILTAYSNAFSAEGSHAPWGGVKGHGELSASDLPNLATTNAYPGGSFPYTLIVEGSETVVDEDNFLCPDYRQFADVDITLLPLPTANNASSVGDAIFNNVVDIDPGLSKFDNHRVFTEYAATITDNHGRLVQDSEGRTFFAALIPRTILTGNTEAATLQDDPLTPTSVMCPLLRHVWERHLYCLDGEGEESNGVLLWSVDLSQRVAGYAEYADLFSLGSYVGDATTEELPLADNVWHIVPCGRVLFVVLDYHLEGPNHPPTTVLEVRAIATGEILSTVELTFADTVLSQDYDVWDPPCLDPPGAGPLECTSAQCNPEDPADTSCMQLVDHYRTGDRDWNVSAADIRIKAAVNAAGQEWCFVYCPQRQRSAYALGSGGFLDRVLRVEVAASLEDDPNIEDFTLNGGPTSFSNGINEWDTAVLGANNLYWTRYDFTGGRWQLVAAA